MKKNHRIIRLLSAFVFGVIISAFSLGTYTVQAAETAQNTAEAAASGNAGGAVLILMGGMLVIIIAVVLSVVASVVSSVAAVSVDED